MTTKTPELTKYQMHLVFHKMWTACNGQRFYDKKQWMEIEHQLRQNDVISEVDESVTDECK